MQLKNTQNYLDSGLFLLYFLLEGAWAFYRLFHPLSLQPLYTKSTTFER